MGHNSKDDILDILKANRGEDVSGQKLAETLGISRNAVWKAVHKLQAEGHRIESATNRGYRLRSDSDVLQADDIIACLDDAHKDLDVRVYACVDSTNNEAKRLLANGLDHAALLLAEEQTGGRGRMGRAFYSPKGTGLYMTLILPWARSLADAVHITTAASVAVVRAVERLTGRRLSIKWVNDVYLDDKKLCGILTEAVSDFETGRAQSVIVGIGVNVSTADFPAEVRQRATSLFTSGVTRNRMAAAITDELLRASAHLGDASDIAFYKAHSMVLGKAVTYTENGIARQAVAVDIDETGGLVVRHADGSERTLHTGEITLRVV
ncbi:MAG: biotin--[acetyl-CoA-carboxylase] ligase [Clostridia bacterium]|nr:biotin--[acetyl-CoA-carboxylase] ligase [Clostridia bacterium]